MAPPAGSDAVPAWTPFAGSDAVLDAVSATEGAAFAGAAGLGAVGDAVADCSMLEKLQIFGVILIGSRNGRDKRAVANLHAFRAERLAAHGTIVERTNVERRGLTALIALLVVGFANHGTGL